MVQDSGNVRVNVQIVVDIRGPWKFGAESRLAIISFSKRTVCFMDVASYSLKMEAARSPETSVNFFQTKRSHIQETVLGRRI